MKALEAQFRETWREGMASSAVSCFSKVGDHPLMWAHYADAHSGLCFTFLETKAPPFFGFEVDYVAERPIVDVTTFGENAGTLELAILTKSVVWQYEQEVRMFDYNLASGPRLFPPRCLRAITLGARISGENREAIMKMVKMRASQIDVFQAEVHSDRYELTFDRVRT